MKVRYNKGMGCPVEISDGKTATCISLDTAKELQASLLAVIKQAEMPEEEMSEFEKEYCRLYKEGYADGQAGSEQLSDAVLKASASELLSLAREQFIKDGYIIKKKAFHDAVEIISDKHLAEMSVQYSVHCKVEDGTRHAVLDWSEFQKVAQKFIDIGRAETVSDIPESNF